MNLQRRSQQHSSGSKGSTRCGLRPRCRSVLALSLVLAMTTNCGAPTVKSPEATKPAGPTSAPLVETPPEAPTVIDVPATVLVEQQVAAEGATITAAGATLAIPAGAVATATNVEVVRVDAPFHMNPYARDEAEAVPAWPAGPVLDFGPAGLSFDQPVEITLPYDPQAAAGADVQPALAYWTGERWLLLEGFVDEQAHTVSVLVASFEGIALTTLLIGTGLVAIWTYVGVKIMSHNDPITEGVAGQYVTPQDPAVVSAARGAQLAGIPLANETALAAHLQGLGGSNAPILIPDANGTPKGISYSQASGANWQKPTDYLSPTPTGTTFDGVPAIGGRRGDCTDAANAFTSMFRALGYPAQGVFGYAGDTDSPHAWVEVSIGGKPYLVDERGNIQELEAAMKASSLIRPDPSDPRAFGWDETGQRAYLAEWWTKVPARTQTVAGVWTGTFTFTDFDGVGRPGELECNSNNGLPLTVWAQMEIRDLGEGRYFANVSSDMVMCLVDYASSHDDTVVSKWMLSVLDEGRWVSGVEFSLTGRTLSGSDPQGTSYTGEMSLDGSTLTGTFAMLSDGDTTYGTWSLSR